MYYYTTPAPLRQRLYDSNSNSGSGNKSTSFINYNFYYIYYYDTTSYDILLRP